MYIVGQEETVGESSVSSGCWGEDSDHEYGWARRTPTFVAPIRFFDPTLPKTISHISCVLECTLPIERWLVHRDNSNRSLALQRLQVRVPAHTSKYEIMIGRGL